MQKRIPVAVLAATGSVGQRFIQLLDRHPWFEVVALTGSERTAGKLYGEACSWIVPGGMPTWAREMTITGTTPTAVNVAIAFSALPADQAKDIEPQFAQAGIAVCTNASANRLSASRSGAPWANSFPLRSCDNVPPTITTHGTLSRAWGRRRVPAASATGEVIVTSTDCGPS
jgi:hypothetical protein